MSLLYIGASWFPHAFCNSLFCQTICLSFSSCCWAFDAVGRGKAWLFWEVQDRKGETICVGKGGRACQQAFLQLLETDCYTNSSTWILIWNILQAAFQVFHFWTHNTDVFGDVARWHNVGLMASNNKGIDRLNRPPDDQPKFRARQSKPKKLEWLLGIKIPGVLADSMVQVLLQGLAVRGTGAGRLALTQAQKRKNCISCQTSLRACFRNLVRL